MTGFPKPVRLENPELLAAVRLQPCAACKRPGPSDPNHVRTRGAGGGDTADNVMPLCREHHTEWHAMGARTTAAKYYGVRDWLEAAGRWDVLHYTRNSNDENG